MSGELGGLIRGHEAGLEAAADGRAMGAAGRARVIASARRARLTRTVLMAAAGVVVAGLAGGGALLLARPDPVPPVQVVTPSPTPTMPAPSPTATPTEAALPDPGFAGTVTVDAHLPSALPITPEAWASAGSGWVLASYQERWYTDSDPRWAAGPQVIYLISPDGERYQLVRPVTDLTAHVVAWRPKQTSALVYLESWLADDPSAAWARLDLVSGQLSPVSVEPPTHVTGPPLPDGRVPLGDRLAVDIEGAVTPIDPIEAPGALAAVEAAYPEHDCTVTARFDSQSVVVSCEKPLVADDIWMWLMEPLLLRAWQDGRVEVLAWSDAEHHDMPGGPWWEATVVDGTVVTSANDWSVYGCPIGRYTIRNGTFAILPGVAASSFPDPNIFIDAGSSGTSTYTVVTAGCSGDMQSMTLVRDDLATGEHVELAPYPTAGAQAAGTWLSSSLNGYYVVP